MTTISGPWAGPAGGWSVPAVTPQAQDLTVAPDWLHVTVTVAWSVRGLVASTPLPPSARCPGPNPGAQLYRFVLGSQLTRVHAAKLSRAARGVVVARV